MKVEISYHTLYFFFSLIQEEILNENIYFQLGTHSTEVLKKLSLSFYMKYKITGFKWHLKNNDSFHTIKFIEIGNVGS